MTKYVVNAKRLLAPYFAFFGPYECTSSYYNHTITLLCCLVQPASIFDVAVGAWLLHSDQPSYSLSALASVLPPSRAIFTAMSSQRLLHDFFTVLDVAHELQRRLELHDLRIVSDLEMSLVPIMTRTPCTIGIATQVG